MKSKTVKLKQLAHFDSGYQFRGKVETFDRKKVERLGMTVLPEELVKVIQIKDIDDDRRLQVDDLITTRLERSPDKYRVEQGDVLFLARGHRLFAAAVGQRVDGAIASGYFLILRLKTDAVRPDYLAWYLNQPRFQAALKPLMRGSHMPLVTRSDVESLRVHVPPLAVQEAIVQLDELERQEQKLLAAIKEKRSQLIQAISMKAAGRTS